MMPIRVQPGDPRLEPFLHISDARMMQERGLFVAEGRMVVQRLLADPRYTVESMLVNAASLAALRDGITRLPGATPVFECATSAFEAVTGFNIHRGCLALVRRPAALSWREAAGASSVVVVLEGVSDADNVGSVFRNAAALGAGAVLLSPTCCDPLYRKAIRTSMGHVLRVPFARLAPWPEALEAVGAAGFMLAALTQIGRAHV